MEKATPEIIAIANQKGGVAKTTTTGAIAAVLGQKFGYKVLCIDMDPQANLTDNSGAQQNNHTDDVLRGNTAISEHIQKTKNYDILAASISLAAIEQELSGVMGREYKLAEAINSDSKLSAYDYILIDTPPSLGTLTVASLVAADAVIIPSLADINAARGIGQLGHTVHSVKKYFNRNLEIKGILLTRFVSRYNFSKVIKELTDMIADSLHTKVFDTYIRDTIKAPEANYSKQSLCDYNPKSTVSRDYEAFVCELLGRLPPVSDSSESSGLTYGTNESK